MATTTGTAPFTVSGETYHTWYKIVGDLANRTRRPLVTLHGGPGYTHDSILSISDLSTSRPVIFYDQLGNGRSTHLREKPKTFWTYDLFVDELANLLAYLGIEDDFDFLGHSAGGLLGVEFEVRRQPPGLKHLILSNTFADVDLYRAALKRQQEEFPQWVQDAIAAGPLADRQKYWDATGVVQAVHMCRMDPMPADLLYSKAQVFGEYGDPTVVLAMVFGELKDWKIINRLHLVRVPTLLINGRWDMVEDITCEGYFRHIKQIKWITFDNASHTPMWEDRERYMKLVEDFLTH